MSEPSAVVPPPQISAKYMLETCREFSCRDLTKWADLTVDNYKHQWLLWGTFGIPKLQFLKARLCSDSADCVEWYVEASDPYCESKVTFLQKKVSQLTDC